MNIREQLESNEHLILDPTACFADSSAGRPVPEADCPVRTIFQRDTDRIVHSNAFSRLKHKTQVFLSPLGDHYTTRLTHTLQVSQIARTMARALRLNENLTEAIALGHDVGHTPFGHAGEMALNEILDGGFRHYEHSVRVLQLLEKSGHGLNLCHEVIDGIICHTKDRWSDCLEGRLVRHADRIAYVNHDIDDAVRAGVIDESNIPDIVKQTLGATKSQRISALVLGVIENAAQTDLCGVGVELQTAFDTLHEFMYDKVYIHSEAKREETKAIAMLKLLYEYYCKNPQKLPGEVVFGLESESKERIVADYIAGMTDRYAIYSFEEIFVPKSWGVS